MAIDCDNMRTTPGQKPDDRGTNDAGGNSNPAVETNAIGHAQRFSGVVRLFRFLGSGVSRTGLYGGIISFVTRADQ